MSSSASSAVVNVSTNRVVATPALSRPGLDSFENRLNENDLNADGYLSLRRDLDGVPENLWRIRGDLYDLSEFAKEHPGGTVWIDVTRGTDCTEAFEIHHVRKIAEVSLAQMKRVADPGASAPAWRQRFAFDEDYAAMKTRVAEYLKSIKNPTGRTPLYLGLIHTLVWGQFAALATLTARTRSKRCAVLTGLSMIGMWGTSHNQMHRSRYENNPFAFLRYGMDVTGFSHHEQTVTHALSHHLYPNTLLDVEVSFFTPLRMLWLTQDPEGEEISKDSGSKVIQQLLRWGLLPFFASLAPMTEMMLRFGRLVKRRASLWRSDVLAPLMLLGWLKYWAKDWSTVLKLYAVIYMSFGAAFVPLGVMLHHGLHEETKQPVNWHHGEPSPPKESFVEHQLETTSDHSIELNPYLSVVCWASLNLHTIHHLFPTIDTSFHREILAILYKENTGNFRVLYDKGSKPDEYGPAGGRSASELFWGFLRHARERVFLPTT